jgi:hypothetical protein
MWLAMSKVAQVQHSAHWRASGVSSVACQATHLVLSNSNSHNYVVMRVYTVVLRLIPLDLVCGNDDNDCYLISPSLAAIGTAPNCDERKLLITSTTLCPFQCGADRPRTPSAAATCATACSCCTVFKPHF